MRILFLALGDRNVASSRIRAWNFASHVRESGHIVEVFKGASRSALKKVLLRRWDVIVVQKWVPPLWMVPAVRLSARTVIYDCDDAIYLVDEAKERVGKARDSRKQRHRATRLARRLPIFLRICDGYTTATKAISADLNAIAAKAAFVFPGPMPSRVVDLDENVRSGMVWLGSPATERYLARLTPILANLQGDLKFTAMGASEVSAGLGIATSEWTESGESELLRSSLLGLFIQPSGAWEDRKSGYKILEYVASGVIPVVQKNAQVLDLLPPDYPFYFDAETEPKEMLGVLRLASSMTSSDAHELHETILRHAQTRFSFDATVNRWLNFVESVRVLRVR